MDPFEIIRLASSIAILVGSLVFSILYAAKWFDPRGAYRLHGWWLLTLNLGIAAVMGVSLLRFFGTYELEIIRTMLLVMVAGAIVGQIPLLLIAGRNDT